MTRTVDQCELNTIVRLSFKKKKEKKDSHNKKQTFGVVLFSVFSVVSGFTNINKTPK